jgi:hypothetical protein
LIVRTEEIVWKPYFPGAEIAQISGDPEKAGAPYVLRIRYTRDLVVPPHFHTTDEHITVLQGSYLVGLGEHFDAAKGGELTAGGYALLKKKVVNFGLGKNNTIIQIHGVGPFKPGYNNPADDPHRTAQ